MDELVDKFLLGQGGTKESLKHVLTPNEKKALLEVNGQRKSAQKEGHFRNNSFLQKIENMAPDFQNLIACSNGSYVVSSRADLQRAFEKKASELNNIMICSQAEFTDAVSPQRAVSFVESEAASSHKSIEIAMSSRSASPDQIPKGENQVDFITFTPMVKSSNSTETKTPPATSSPTSRDHFCTPLSTMNEQEQGTEVTPSSVASMSKHDNGNTEVPSPALPPQLTRTGDLSSEVPSPALPPQLTKTGDLSSSQAEPDDNDEENQPPAVYTPMKTAQSVVSATPMAEKLLKDEDAAFLPDDFKEHLLQNDKKKRGLNYEQPLSPLSDSRNFPYNSSSYNENEQNPAISRAKSETSEQKVFSFLELQARVASGVEEAQEHWLKQARKEIEEEKQAAIARIESDAEQQLVQQGSQWQAEHEEEIRELRDQMDKKVSEELKKGERSKEDALAKLALDFESEREALQRKIEEVNCKYKTENEEQKVELMKKIDIMRTENREQLVKEKNEFQARLLLERKQHEEEVKALVERHNEEINQESVKHESDIKDQIDTHMLELQQSQSKCHDLETTLAEIQQNYQEEIKAQKAQCDQNLKEVTLDIERRFEEKAAATQEEHNSQIARLQEEHAAERKKHAEEIELMRKELSETIEMQRVAMKDNDTEKVEFELCLQRSKDEHEFVIQQRKNEMEELRQEMENRLHTQRKEMEDNHRKRLETENDKHHQQLRELTERHEAELDTAQESTEELQQELREHIHKQNSILAANDELRKEVESLVENDRLAQNDHVRHIEELVEKHALEVERQTDEFSKTKLEMESRLEEQKKEIESEKVLRANDVEKLRHQIKKAEEEHTSQAKKRSESHELEVQKLNGEIKRLQMEISTIKDETENRLEEQEKNVASEKLLVNEIEKLQHHIKNAAEAHLSEAKLQEEAHRSEVRMLQAELETSKVEMETKLDDQRKKMEESKSIAVGMSEKTLLLKIAQLEAEREDEKAKHTSQLKKMKAEHNAEFDEVIAQLDLVEMEHKTKLEQKTEQKDAIIAALGAQLADATAKITSNETEFENHSTMLENARAEAGKAKQAQKDAESQLRELREMHLEALDAEKEKRRQACAHVEKEMIAAAEEQFGRANETYLQLKDEYSLTKGKLEKTERELAAVKREANNSMRQRASKEVEVTAEIAQLKAALATAEAQTARKTREYNREVENLTAAEAELRSKVEKANSSCTAAHVGLATVVAEKERLSKELNEMKSVCEELMAIVEGGQK